MVTGRSLYVQAYSTEFVNLVDTGTLPSIRIHFHPLEFSTWGKATAEWRAFIEDIDVEKLRQELALLFA